MLTDDESLSEEVQLDFGKKKIIETLETTVEKLETDAITTTTTAVTLDPWHQLMNDYFDSLTTNPFTDSEKELIKSTPYLYNLLENQIRNWKTRKVTSELNYTEKEIAEISLLFPFTIKIKEVADLELPTVLLCKIFAKTTEVTLEEIASKQNYEQGTLAWLKERERVVTASKYGDCCNMGYNSPREYLQDKLFNWPAPNKRSQYYMKQGNKCEPFACRDFEIWLLRWLKRYRPNFKTVEVEHSGLEVHPEYPWSGDSKDGLITINRGLKDEEVYLLEIKCPANKIYSEIPKAYYAQITGIMGFNKIKGAFFFIWKPEEFKVEFYMYDSALFKTMLERMRRWWFVEFVPRLMLRDNGYITCPNIDIPINVSLTTAKLAAPTTTTSNTTSHSTATNSVPRITGPTPFMKMKTTYNGPNLFENAIKAAETSQSQRPHFNDIKYGVEDVNTTPFEPRAPKMFSRRFNESGGGEKRSFGNHGSEDDEYEKNLPAQPTKRPAFGFQSLNSNASRTSTSTTTAAASSSLGWKVLNAK